MCSPSKAGETAYMPFDRRTKLTSNKVVLLLKIHSLHYSRWNFFQAIHIQNLISYLSVEPWVKILERCEALLWEILAFGRGVFTIAGKHQTVFFVHENIMSKIWGKYDIFLGIFTGLLFKVTCTIHICRTFLSHRVWLQFCQVLSCSNPWESVATFSFLFSWRAHTPSTPLPAYMLVYTCRHTLNCPDSETSRGSLPSKAGGAR